MLIKIAENCTSNLTVQQYAFTRVEEILGLGIDLTDVDSDAFGSKHAHLFTSDGVHLIDNSFVRALSSSDIYLQKSAALSLACLLTVCEGNIVSLIHWILQKLSSITNGVWDMALPPLTMLCRSQSARKHLIAAGMVTNVVSTLRRLGVNGNSQQIYELSFILWAMAMGEVDLNAFLSAGAVPMLVEIVAASPTRKVTRVAICALKNLASNENADVINEMLTAGLLKLLDYIHGANVLKQTADVELENDFKYLHDTLHKNYRELSTFERWTSEVNSGALR